MVSLVTARQSKIFPQLRQLTTGRSSRAALSGPPSRALLALPALRPFLTVVRMFTPMSKTCTQVAVGVGVGVAVSAGRLGWVCLAGAEGLRPTDNVHTKLGGPASSVPVHQPASGLRQALPHLAGILPCQPLAGPQELHAAAGHVRPAPPARATPRLLLLCPARCGRSAAGRGPGDPVAFLVYLRPRRRCTLRHAGARAGCVPEAQHRLLRGQAPTHEALQPGAAGRKAGSLVRALQATQCSRREARPHHNPNIHPAGPHTNPLPTHTDANTPSQPAKPQLDPTLAHPPTHPAELHPNPTPTH